MALYQEYFSFKTKLEKATNDEKSYKNYITILNSLSKDRFIVGSVLDNIVRNYNGYLNNKMVCKSALKTYKFREKKKDNFFEYAKYEALEESGVILSDDNLIYIVPEENSRIFPKRETEDIYKTAVYIANIGDITLQCKEPDKN
ncbi:11201_t:CDS:2, partial [Scutellospora calospora]